MAYQKHSSKTLVVIFDNQFKVKFINISNCTRNRKIMEYAKKLLKVSGFDTFNLLLNSEVTDYEEDHLKDYGEPPTYYTIIDGKKVNISKQIL
jgi:hypothetical protein